MVLFMPEMPAEAPSASQEAMRPVLAALTPPPPTKPLGKFHWGIDSVKSLWDGAVGSGLVTSVLLILGDLPTKGHPAWWVFGVTMLVTALRTALRLWQSEPPKTIGGMQDRSGVERP